MPRRRRRALELFASTVEAQAAAVMTLGRRVPALVSGTSHPAERTRMVTEKIEAAVESARAVGQVAAKLVGRAAVTPPTVTSAISGWLVLAEAASRPYHRRVKANATRLSKARRRRSG